MSGTDSSAAALLLALSLLCGCVTAGPPSDTGDSEQRDEDRGACPSTKDPGPNRDALGRLVTGPGLCRIEGAAKNTSTPSTNVTLELRYDNLGRPLEVHAWFEPQCPTEGLPGHLYQDHDECWTSEHQIQRWTWDKHGRLVKAAHWARAEFERAETGDPEIPVGVPDASRCLFGDDPVLIEGLLWRYDQAGRLVSHAVIHQDCESAEIWEERLRHQPGVIESKVEFRDEPASERWTARYHLDECGRVLRVEREPAFPKAASRYEYDSRGRLMASVNGEGSKRRFDYTAEIAGSTAPAWLFELADDSRLLWLTRDVPGGDRFEIRLDERSRVVAVELEHRTWTLSYDDCPNAKLAQTRWRFDEILLAGWPFPTPPQPGEGATALDKWLHGELPLTPQI